MQEGKSNKAIAKVLGRSTSTIGRELERNCWQEGCRRYQGEKAQGFSDRRRKRERKSRISEKIWQEIFEMYNKDWSPEQISGVLKLRGIYVSHETIYRRIYAEIQAGRLEREHLRWCRKKRRRRLSKRAPRDLTKISIENRLNLNSRAEFGHWEGDTVEIKRGSKYLVTLVERKTRFLMTALVTNKKADTVRSAIEAVFRRIPGCYKSITFDNGTEFAQHQLLAKPLNVAVYFAHPHAPWERGTNENTNRLLRQYFPKKTDVVIDSAILANCRQKINTRPRKCLNFASPAQHFFLCLNLLQGVAFVS